MTIAATLTRKSPPGLAVLLVALLTSASLLTPLRVSAAPQAPSNLAATVVGSVRVDLTWTDNATGEQGFHVQAAADAAFTNPTVFTAAANVTAFSHTAVTPGSTIHYRVSSFDATGDSAFSNTVTVSIPQPPAAPTNLAATVISATQINLTWTDNATTETGYRVERATDSTFSTAKVTFTLAANAASHSDTTAAAGIIYFYRVFATGATDSAPSNVISITTTAPAAPAGLSATMVSATQVNLAWTDNATNETGYRVDRAADSAFSSGLVSTQLPANSTAHSDVTVQPARTYFYRVLALNSAGLSAPSNPAAAATPDVAPSAPTTLTATAASPTQVNLLWVDTATNETAYRVERAASAAFAAPITTFPLPPNSTTYSDISAAANTTYFYRVFASNAIGSSPASNIQGVTTPDNVPAAPSGLTAVAVSPTQVNLTWTDNAANETAYKVERSTATTFAGATSFALPPNAANYSDTTAAPATTYFYRVKASNATGDSPASNTVTLATTDAVPTAPSGLVAMAAGPNQVNLTWTDNATNETGYRVERAADATFTGAISFTLPANTTSYSDITVAPTTTYFYRVIATNGTGPSQASNPASVATPVAVPAAPTTLATTVAGPNQVNLTWTDNATNETGYKVERAANASFTGSVSFTLPADTTAHADTTTSPATAYFYRVVAFNSTGPSLPSNAVPVLTPDVIPATPSALTIVASSHDQVSLTWTDNASNETAYRIERATDALFTANLVSFALPANSVSYTDTTTLPTTTYFFRVVASNAIGPSSASNVSSVTTPAAAIPAAPTALSAVSASPTRVNLRWTDNATNETAYRIERATDDGFTANRVSFAAAANSIAYSDTTTVAGGAYFYRVVASNSSGDSPPSNVSNLTTPLVALPDAPTGLTATAAGPTQVNLTWTDAATNETAYRVERATDAAFTSPTSFSLAANVATYSDTTAAPATAYFYRVLASNVAGSSPASNTATVTTPVLTAPAAPTNLTGAVVSNILTNLTWTDNATNETGYRIERATDTTFTTGLVTFTALANATTHSDTSTVAGTTYYYRVFALNAAGNSTPSNTATTTVSATFGPAAPTSLTATVVTSTWINLTWLDNATGETGYRIERATDTTFTTGLVSFTAAANAATYSDTTALAGIPYSYRVFATSASGDSLPSNVATVTTTGTSTGPTAPSSLIGTALGPTQVNLTWIDNATNETGYRVERATDTSFTAGLSTFYLAANSISYSNTTAVAGTTYYFRVIATGSTGDSSPSNVATVTTTGATGPAAPSSLVASVLSASQINLTWVDNALNETGYRIERATDGAFSGGLTTFYLAANSISYLSTGLTAGTTYYFRVVATGASGDSTPSNAATATTHASTSTLSAPAATQLTPLAGAAPATPAAPARDVAVAGLTATPALKVTTAGAAVSATQLKAPSGKVIIDIAAGTKITDAAGQPAQAITLSETSARLTAPPLSVLVASYTMEPSGVKFDQPITLSIKYDPASLPPGVKPADLYIGYWDGKSWQDQSSTANVTTNTVSARISHFSVYALLGKLRSEAPAGTRLSGLKIAPETASAGQKVEISFTATNTRGSPNKVTFVLRVNGAEEGKRDMELAAEGSKKITFTTSRKSAATYNIDVGGLTGSFTVKEGAPAKKVPLWAIAAMIAVAIVAALLVFAFGRGGRPGRGPSILGG